MIKAMTPETTDRNIWSLSERIRFNWHCRFNLGVIKLQILISNYLWINLVSTRHLRPCYAKRKMFVDDSSQKIGHTVKPEKNLTALCNWVAHGVHFNKARLDEMKCNSCSSPSALDVRCALCWSRYISYDAFQIKCYFYLSFFLYLSIYLSYLRV